MSLVNKYSDPQGIEEPTVLVEITAIRWGTVGVAMSAALGEPDISTIEVQDVGGVYDFQGLRAWDMRETSAPSNNQMIGRFVIQDREVGRSAEEGLLVGADRLWSIDMTDYNYHLGKRLLVDSDANRPAESPGDRIRWLLHRAEHISLNDYGHVTYPTSPQLEANDYRGQRANDVLVDCALEGQYNFWVDFNEAHGRPELFFFDPDGTAYRATIAISNVPGDADGTTVFYPYRDGKLRRSPERLAYGALVQWENGWVYRSKAITGTQFAQQDQSATDHNVKSAARAVRIANVYINKFDEEDDSITCAIKVPRALVNAVRHGQRITVRFQHLPGYETDTQMRVTHRSVLQEEEGGDTHYKIELTLTPVEQVVPGGGSDAGDFTGDAFAGLQRTNAYSSIGYFPAFAGTYNTGQNFGGWGEHEESGPLHVVESAAPWRSISTSHDIIVRISARGEGANVFFPAQTRTLSITVNGVVIGTDSRSTLTGFESWNRSVDIHNYHLSAGDVVSVTGTATDEWGNSAINHTYLLVGRGAFGASGVVTPDDPSPAGWSGP